MELGLKDKHVIVTGGGTNIGRAIVHAFGNEGSKISIAELARMIAVTVGYQGKFRFLNEKPDGTPRKLADTTKLNNLGWSPDISLADGLRSTYKWYTEYRVG